VLVLVAYWFLALAPKRKEAGKLGTELTKQAQRRDDATAELRRVESAKKTFDQDFATVVRLGKAIPTAVDVPTLIVQLNEAAKGTHIDFERIKSGERLTAGGSATGSAPSTPPSGQGGGSGGGQPAPASGQSSSGGSGAPPAAPGGQAASSGPGKAAEKAGDAKQSADARSSAAGGSGAAPPASGAGAAPPSGGGAGAAGSSSGVPGLDAVPLEFTFTGSFFDLTDFFHDLKRFVRVTGDELAVRGRLMTISGFTFKATTFPRIEAQVQAMVYLSPKGEGTTAGATPSGPSQPAGGGQPAPAAAPPTATATP
jgi:Tfp pilus assembly protein PilO